MPGQTLGPSAQGEKLDSGGATSFSSPSAALPCSIQPLRTGLLGGTINRSGRNWSASEPQISVDTCPVYIFRCKSVFGGTVMLFPLPREIASVFEVVSRGIQGTGP